MAAQIRQGVSAARQAYGVFFDVGSRAASSMRATTRISKRRQPKAVLTVTDTAVKHIQELLSEKPDAIGIRVGVKKRGCSGSAFHLEYAYDIEKGAEVIEASGVRVLVEPKAILQILHSTMDYEETDTSEGFVFENPQAQGTCGCGESFF